MMITTHEPVLLKEVIEALHIKNQGKYIDCTLGAGGYSKAICEAGGEVLAIDADESMIEVAKKNLEGLRVKIVHGNFRNLKRIAEENNFSEVDGIVVDLGVSNLHFASETRGFSFRNPEAYLDMRIDRESQMLKASDLLNLLREDQLRQIFGRKLANEIAEFRETKRFEKVGDFLSLFPKKQITDRVHPATKAFLLLRIAVNSELDNLREVLPKAFEILKPEGRLVVVSFHSLEDEIVKEFMKSKDFVKPSIDETIRNPKSRSAIMRVLIK